MTKTTKPPALFSTVLFPEGGHETLPDPVNPYFVIGGMRRYIHKKMHFGNVLVPVDKIDTLPDLPENWKAFAWFDIPPIPAEMIGQAWGFFRSIYNQRKSEAMLDIYYHREHGYRFFIPPQIASGGGVRCIRNPEHIQIGWRHVGTMHSHCNMSAFHSGTDKHDADEHDGIHFTIGKVTSNPAEIAVMASANGVKWDLELKDVTEGDIPFAKHPKWWERYVEHPLAKEHFALPETPKGHVSTWGGKGGSWREDEFDHWNRGSWPFSGPHTQAPGDKTPTLYAEHKALETLAKRIAEKEHLNLVDEAELNFLTESIQEDIYRLDEDLRLLGIQFNVSFRYAPHLRPKDANSPNRGDGPNANLPTVSPGQITASL